MEQNKSLVFYHILAVLTIIIWGTTFVSTKVLLQNGLDPVEVMFYRFAIAYVCILFITHNRLWANSWKDEGLLFLLGITGGSLYFIAENTALQYTQASNVALLVCTAPLFTALVSHWFGKEPLHKNTLKGGFVGLIGVALVVFNGSVLLEINPLGDFLSLTSAAMWAFYCLILKRLEGRYPTLYITRKVFAYGILSLVFYFLFYPLEIKTDILLRPVVSYNLLFLGIVASMVCFFTYNIAVKHIGAIKAINYGYIQPLVTMVTSAIVLSETITVASLIGAVFIIGGVYWAEK